MFLSKTTFLGWKLAAGAVFGYKKVPAASRQPRIFVFFLENAIFDQKKAPAAMGQQEGNGFFLRETLFLAKKRRLRQ